jgi:hypothetical protein
MKLLKLFQEGDSVTVECTDTGNSSKGIVVHARREGIAVTLEEAKGTLLFFKQVKPKLFVGNHIGLEFVIKA